MLRQWQHHVENYQLKVFVDSSVVFSEGKQDAEKGRFRHTDLATPLEMPGTDSTSVPAVDEGPSVVHEDAPMVHVPTSAFHAFTSA